MSYDYQEVLKSPKWQRKRLKILERDGWKCLCCGEQTRTLHVHHLKYGKGQPWEVPDEWLESLCDECHEFRERFDFLFAKELIPTEVCWRFFSAWPEHAYDFMPMRVTYGVGFPALPSVKVTYGIGLPPGPEFQE